MTVKINDNEVTFTHTGLNTTPGRLVIGAELWEDGSILAEYTGSVDDVRVYNRALTDAEINDLYNTANPGTGDQNLKLLEDWNTTPALDAAWGDSNVHDSKLYISGGKLHQIIRPYSTQNSENYLTTHTAFPSSIANDLTAFEATVRIESIGNISAAPEIDYAITDFFGSFYNINATPSNAAGDIQFVARIGDRGNGLEAWYYLTRVDDANYSFTDLTTGIFPPPGGGWQTGVDYILRVVYDGNNSFTASIGGQQTDITPVVGPSKGGVAWWAGKSFRTRVRVNRSFTGDPDAYMIHSVYDDVKIDTGGGLVPYDDFNGTDTSLSNTKWSEETLVKQSTVVDNLLKLSTKTAAIDIIDDTGLRNNAILPPEYSRTDSIQVDMMMEGNAIQDTARARVTTEGTFGNGKYSADGNGDDGVIRLRANIEKMSAQSNSYRIICNSFMEDFNNPNNLLGYVDIMWKWVPAMPNTWYTANISRSGNTLNCQFKDTSTGQIVLSDSIDVTTIDGVNPITPIGKSMALFVRDIFAPAEVIGFFDNLYIEKMPGDIDLSGEIDLSDIIIGLQALSGLNPTNMSSFSDINGDKKIGMEEILYDLKYISE